MKLIHMLLLLLFIGPTHSKPVDDDDQINVDSVAKSDTPGDAGSTDNPGNADNPGNGDKAANSDKASNADDPGNADNPAPSGGDEKKDKDKTDDTGASATDAAPAPSDISPADAGAGDKKSDDASPDAAAPTPTGKTPSKTPTGKTGKTPTPTKGPTSKPTTAENKDKKDDTPTTSAPTNKPSKKVTSPSPTSPTKPPKSTPQPTIIKKASIPTSPKPTTAASTKAKTTAAPTKPSTAAPTHKPTKAATTKAPPAPPSDADARSKIYRNDGYGQTVEKSNNNTLKMNGTTFRVAVRLLEEKWTEDLDFQKNPVFQNLKKTVMSAVAIVYDGYHDFKQIAIIGFSETPANDSDADKRDSIAGNSVIADFYLRFFSFGKHLKKLTDAIKNEKVGSLSVTPKFVKAYTAEPKGRVCTSDCRIKCYSYCDDGCCIFKVLQHDQPKKPTIKVLKHVELPNVNFQWPTPSNLQHTQVAGAVASSICRGSACIERKPTPLNSNVNSNVNSNLNSNVLPEEENTCRGAACVPNQPTDEKPIPIANTVCHGEKCDHISRPRFKVDPALLRMAAVRLRNSPGLLSKAIFEMHPRLLNCNTPQCIQLRPGSRAGLMLQPPPHVTDRCRGDKLCSAWLSRMAEISLTRSGIPQVLQFQGNGNTMPGSATTGTGLSMAKIAKTVGYHGGIAFPCEDPGNLDCSGMLAPAQNTLIPQVQAIGINQQRAGVSRPRMNQQIPQLNQQIPQLQTISLVHQISPASQGQSINAQQPRNFIPQQQVFGINAQQPRNFITQQQEIGINRKSFIPQVLDEGMMLSDDRNACSEICLLECLPTCRSICCEPTMLQERLQGAPALYLTPSRLLL